MSEINDIHAAIQQRQFMVQNEMGIQLIKQAAQAKQALADMLAENVKDAEQTVRKLEAGKNRIDIYV